MPMMINPTETSLWRRRRDGRSFVGRSSRFPVEPIRFDAEGGENGQSDNRQCTHQGFGEGDADPVKQERALAVAAALRQRIPLDTNWQAFEYGCGSGWLSFALHADLDKVTLADSSPGMLTVLKKRSARRD